MDNNLEDYAKYFLEISSEQRLRIIQLIADKEFRLSELAKKLGATTSEVHRNLERLEVSGFIAKNTSGHFEPTILGQMVLSLIPNLAFVIQNKKYFEAHPINSLPHKFVSRFGELFEAKLLSSYVDVFDYWKKIYATSQEYIYNILYEVPYFEDFTKPLYDKLSEGVKIKSIFYEKAMISDTRADVVKKLKKFIDNGNIQRMMTKRIGPAVILNEKQSCLIFPNADGKLDAGYAFVGDDELFRQWCFDYFNYSWYNATPFVEAKLKK